MIANDNLLELSRCSMNLQKLLLKRKLLKKNKNMWL